MNKYVLITVIVLMVATALLFFLPERAVDIPLNFFESGNIVRDTPGLEEGWHLIYEKPGQPALSMKLEFGQWSFCGSENEMSVCEPDLLEQGKRVYVEGWLEENSVMVRDMVFLED